MNRARWITSVVTLTALWLLGALVLAPRVQNALETAARETLERQPVLVRRLDRLQLAFDGQQARLRGAVRTAQDRSAIEQTVRDLVRAPTPLAASLGLRLNPVSAVHHEIEVAPLPPGWLLLAATGPQARLLGTAANEFEARDLARSVQEGWGTRGGVVQGMPRIDGDHHDEAASVTATLRGVPAPQSRAQFVLTRIGQPWKSLTPEQSDAALLAEARLHGVTEAEWQAHVLPALQEVREAARTQHAAEVEEHRRATQPRGHVFIATRGQEITLRGEVADSAVKGALLDEALAVFAPRRVHDEVRISPQRRPGGEFASVSTALLPAKDAGQEKTLYLGLGWRCLEAGGLAGGGRCAAMEKRPPGGCRCRAAPEGQQRTHRLAARRGQTSDRGPRAAGFHHAGRLWRQGHALRPVGRGIRALTDHRGGTPCLRAAHSRAA
jgi:hypothetical protein